MHVHTVRSPGLSHLSYVVIDGGRAAVIDPRLDLDAYLDLVREADATITHVFETHRNEDLVSGARALSERLDVPVHHGPALDFGYGEGAPDGATFRIGDVELEVLHTPGHTDESLSLALRHCSTGDSNLGVFSGDALFVGDVGRTDLVDDPAEGAQRLYESLHDRILPLGDQALLWPAHGAGSICGSGMADRDVSTLGYERVHNDRLQLDRPAFIDAKLAENHDHPPYFDEMERLNRQGHPGLLPFPDVRPLAPDALVGQVVDVRPPEAWAGCHAEGALCLPASMLPTWAGWWLSYDEPITLIADTPAQVRTALQHLVRLGHTRVGPTLRGGMTAWQTAGRPLGHVPAMSVHTLVERCAEVTVLDVRKPDEWASDHLEGAVNLPLSELREGIDDLPRDRPLVTFCGSGRRATLAAALLRRAGIRDVAICFGSMAAWRAAGLS